MFISFLQHSIEDTANLIGNLEEPTVNVGAKERKTSESPEHLKSTSPIQIPLLGRPQSFGLANSGGIFSFKEHNVTMTFPNGAVTKPAELQMGVLFTGPFRFPSNVTQVSPILWFGARNKKPVKFSRAFEASLPHCIDCSQPGEYNNLGFVKATHDSSFSDKPFVFSEVPVEQTSFTRNKGSIYIKQCCFVCIVHKVPEKALEKTNFCLLNTMSKPFEAKFELNFCVVHGLRTCIEVSYGLRYF